MSKPRFSAPAGIPWLARMESPLTRRITFRDPDLPHQIVLTNSAGGIVVSCNCLLGSEQIIDSRSRWEPGTAYAAWLDWHSDRAVDPAEVAA
jgi:hypothetical protein